ncbi:unnamed protein product [Ixodes hexagonus]
MAAIEPDELNELETRKYAYLLDLAKELGFTCKGNPKKARVIKFIRQSVLPGLQEKGNPALPEDAVPTPAPTPAKRKPALKKADGRGSVPPTPSSSRLHPPGKTPNFAKIHQAAFDKLKSIDQYASQKTKTPSVKSRIPKPKFFNNVPAPPPVSKPTQAPKDVRRVAAKDRTTARSNSATTWAAASSTKAAMAVETRRQRNRVILGQVRSNRRFDLLLANRGINM